MFKQNSLHLPTKAKPLWVLAIIFVVLFSTQIDAHSTSISQASSDLIVFVRPQPLGSGNDNSDIWIMNADGSNETQLTTFSDADRWPALSPDGSKIAYVSYRNELWTLWVMDSDGTNPMQIPYAGNVQAPTWSSDGSQIAFGGDAEDGYEIWTINADGSNPQRLTTNSVAAGNPAWSPDRSQLVYTAEPMADYSDLYTVNSDGTGQTLLVSSVISGFSNEIPSWSPDGTQIATIHSSAGNQGPYDLWVMDADGSNGQVLVQNIANPNVNNLAWSQDGNWLTFTNNSHVWTVNPDGSNPTEIANSGGWESDTNASSFSAPTPTPTPSTAPTPTDTPTTTSTPVPTATPTATAQPTCVAPPSGMVSWWPGDGNANDVVGSNYGTLQNGVTFATGKVDQAFSFDGLASYVRVPDHASLSPVNAMTLDAWIKPASLPDPYTPIVKKSGPNQVNGYALEFSGSNVIFWVYVNGGGWKASASQSVPLGAWSHVAGVYDGTTVRLYVNGSPVGSPTSASGGIVASNQDLNLGRDPFNTTRLYHGLIDEVEFFSRALSAAEIQALYAAGGAGHCPVTPTPTSTSTATRTNTPVPPTQTNTPIPGAEHIVFVRPQPETGADANVWIMNPDGSNQTQLTTWNADDLAPVVSSNGSKVAYVSMRNNQATIWVMNSDGTNPLQLPLNGSNGGPAWSPDGSKLAFSSDSVDWWEVWITNADGSNPQRLTTHGPAAGNPSWSPDGQKLVYGVNPSTGYEDLYTINSNGTGQTLLVSSSSGYSHHQPAWSPDGTQIASIRWSVGNWFTGPYDLWLMNADGSNGHVLVQNIDHPHRDHPAWSMDSNWLLFNKSGQLWRIKRDGTGLTQVTTTGGWSPHTNATTFSDPTPTPIPPTHTPTLTPTQTNTPLPPTSTPTPTPLPFNANAIVFVRPQPSMGLDSNIWIMNADGSNQTQLTTWAGEDHWPALSPNGSKIAYVSVHNNQSQLWLMNSDGTNATQLPVSGNTQRLGWSPDGTKIAFTNDSQDWWEIWTIKADGTNLQRLTTTGAAAGEPAWSPDGQKIIYGVNPSAGYKDLYIMNSDGSGQALLVSASGTGLSTAMAAWSPDGTQIAVVRWAAGGAGPYNLWLMNPDGSNGYLILANIGDPAFNRLAWSGDGNWLVFSKNGQVWRVQKNGSNSLQLTTLGGWEPDTNADIASAIVFVKPQPAFNPPDTDTNIWIMNPDGSGQTQLTSLTNAERIPAISPNGSKIVYQVFTPTRCTLWVMNRDGTNPVQLQVNSTSSDCGSPTWSPDGSQIAFGSNADGFWEIWVINADGSNPHQLSHHPGAAGNPSWSPTGQKLVYITEPSAKYVDLYTINSDGTGQTLLVSASGTGFSNHQPAWSPDGTQIVTIHWTAGSSVGPYDLWLMNANGSNGHVLVSNVDYFDYTNLSWSADSNWIVFSKSGQVYRVKRDGTSLTQITTNGGGEPHTNAQRFGSDPRPTLTPVPPTSTPTLTPTRTNTPVPPTATPTATQPTCVAPPPGMVSWWPGEGNANDRIGTNPGTLQNGVTFATGRVNQAFQFDGTASYVRVPNNASLSPVNAMTVDAWIKPASLPDPYTPIVKKSGPDQVNGYALEFSGSKVIFWVYVNGSGWKASASQPVPLGAWSHVAGVYDGTTVRLYVNGSLVGSPTSASGGIVASSQDLNLGRDPFNTTRLYHGLIDEVEFYNRALSAAEIQALYTAASAGHCVSASKIVYVRPQPQAGADSNIWIMNPDGSNQTQLTTFNGEDSQPIISPNGSRVAYLSVRNNQGTLWVMNNNGTNAVQLPLSNNTQGAAWSPDGSKIAFSNDSVDWWEIWVSNADGSNPQRLTTHGPAAGQPSWSPDGQKLVYGVNPSTGYEDLYTVNSNGTGQTLLISSSTGFSNHQPAWSPDGTQIATVHYAPGNWFTGPYDLWLMNADGLNGHVLLQNIDHPHLNHLSWSKDSNWLLFNKSGQIWRIRRDGTGLTQIITTGGWEPDTNALTFGVSSLTPRLYLPLVINNACDLLYADNFSNSASGWFVGDSGSTLWQYLSGEYRILVRDTEWGGAVGSNAKFSNYAAAVDVRNATGNFGTYGLVFGLSDNWSQFYALLVDPDGIYSLWRFDPSGGWTLLTWGTSNAINEGTATNRLKVERNGSLIKAYINDQLITMGTDGTYTGLRRLGLIVNSYDEPNVDIRFDNFKVYPPICGSMSGLSGSGQLSTGTLSLGAGQTDPGASSLEGPNRLPAVLAQFNASTDWKR
jgi:Tol biopolymer transport system component